MITPAAHGTLSERRTVTSKIYGGAIANYWVYTNPGIDAERGAPVMIWLSGTDKLRTFFNEPWLKQTDINGASIDALAGKPLADIEKQVILSTLQQFRGHRIKTAHALGIGVRTLGMKLKRWREEGELIEAGA